MGNKHSQNAKPQNLGFPESKRIWIEKWKKENADNPRVVFFPGKRFSKINVVKYMVKKGPDSDEELHI